MNPRAWLERSAAARPAHPALITPVGDWSYAQLLGAARAGVAELQARGAGPGTRVGIALPGGLPFAQALHACLLLGACAVPIDTRLSRAERAQLLAACGVSLTEPLGCFTPQPPGAAVTAGPAAPPAAPAPAADSIGQARAALELPLALIHTSGSTSQPRPVELSAGNFLWSAIGSAVALGLDARERWLCALPVSHVGGLSILVRSAIYGTTAVVHERFETDRALHALMHGQVTIASLVATTLARLLDAGLERRPQLRCALTGGGPVPAPLIDRARAAGVPVRLTYGLTESCSQATTAPVAEADPPPDRAGPALFCTRVRIAPDGEILLRGPTLARESIAEDGWLHTGDLGALDERGRLLVSGRIADTIISGGENVAPAEVEAALAAHPGVLEAGVYAAADERWGEAVCAIVVPRDPASAPSPEQLRVLCARQLAPYKVPKRIAIAPGPLPRTRSGKLLRRELARLA